MELARLALAASVFLCAGVARADDPLQAAVAWLGAVRDGDVAALTARTHFPLRARGITGASRACRDVKDASTAARFPAYARCIVADEILRESIPTDLASKLEGWKTVTLVPRGRRRFLDAKIAGQTFVSGWLNGDGITYELVLTVAPDGTVAAVLADAQLVD